MGSKKGFCDLAFRKHPVFSLSDLGFESYFFLNFYTPKKRNTEKMSSKMYNFGYVFSQRIFFLIFIFEKLPSHI